MLALGRACHRQRRTARRAQTAGTWNRWWEFWSGVAATAAETLMYGSCGSSSVESPVELCQWGTGGSERRSACEQWRSTWAANSQRREAAWEEKILRTYNKGIARLVAVNSLIGDRNVPLDRRMVGVEQLLEGIRKESQSFLSRNIPIYVYI